MTKTDQKMTPEESRFWIQQFRDSDGSHTYLRSIKAWLETDRRWKRIETLEELRREMQNEDYFVPRHFRKIDAAIAHLKDEGVKYVPK